MARRVREHEWSATALGPVEGWPQSLRTAVDMVLAMSGPATILWGPAHIQIYNDAYVSVAQDRHPELFGRPAAEGWPEAFDEVVAPLLHASQAGRATRLRGFAVPLRGPDGHLQDRSFDADWMPIRGESGAVAGALQLLTEVTDRRLIEAELRDSEARYRALATAGSFLIYRMSPDWTQMRQMLGRDFLADMSEPTENWADGYLLPEDRPAIFAVIEEAIRTKSLFELEHRVRQADGDVGWVLSRAVPILGPDGEITEWFGAGTDITDRKRAEVALRESNERLNALFDVAPAGLAIADASGKILRFNDALMRIWGTPPAPESSLDYGAWKGRFADTGEPLRAEDWAMARALGTGEFVPGDVVDIQRFDGGHATIINAAAPIRDAAGRVTGGVVAEIDITAQRLAEAALRESQERQAFLLTLSDALRLLADPVEIMAAASEALGRHLGAGRCGYGEVDETGEFFVVERDWTDEIMPSFKGRHLFVGFGPEFVESYRAGRSVLIDDALTDARAAGSEAAFEAAGGVRASLGLPLIKGGRFVAGLFVQQLRPRSWTPRDEALALDVAERTWAAVERARAEGRLRASEEKYRSLFRSIDEGFALIEFLADGEGRSPDFRFLEVNEAFERQTGNRDVAGKLGSEINTGIDTVWIETFGEVARTDEPRRFEIHHRQTDRWYDVYATRVGGVGSRQVCVVFADTTERREREGRQAFLLKLSDALRALANPAAIEEAAARCIGEHLNAGRAYYVHLDETRRVADVVREYRRADCPSLVGSHPYSAYGATLDLLRTARRVVFDDVESEPRISPDNLPAHRALGLGAYVNTALVKDGVLVAAMCVVSAEPRRWTATEVALIEETGERTWDAVERARAEEALRESERKLAEDLRNAELLRGLAERLVTEENAQTIYDELLSAAMSIAEGDAGTVQVLDPETNSLALLSTLNFELTVTERFTNVDASSRTACGISLRTGRRAYADFAQEAEDAGCALLVEAGFRTALAVPLVSRGGRQVGMLNAHWRAAGHRSTERQIRFLELIARQAADLIEQRRAQTVVRESEERLRQFGEASQDILWIRDATTLQWTYLTPAFEAIYGVSREEALSGDNYLNWQDLIVPEDRDRAASAIARVGAGEHVTFEYRVRRPSDGTIRWLRNTDFPITDESGNVTLIGGVGHDVTRMKEIESEIAASQERLRLLMEGIPQLVWRSGDGGLWTWSSPQWQDFTGQGQEESHGMGWLDVVHPDDHATTVRAWEAARPHGLLDVEYRVLRAVDASWIWHHTRSVPVHDGGGRIVEWLGTSTDIHELREMQERQKVLVAELQHRTRNLLGLVRSMADKTARASGDLPDFRARFRDRLEALARVQGLLSRLNEHDRVTFDELIDTELAAMDGSADRVTTHGPSGIRLRSSTVQTLAMALHELATNAIKYGALGQPAGRLDIGWSFEPEGEKELPWLHIDWRESGVAMPPPGSAPRGTGHGRELIERSLPYQLSAKTSYVLGPDGVRCTISIPVSASGAEEHEHV